MGGKKDRYEHDMEMERNGLRRPHMALSHFSKNMHVYEISHIALLMVFTLAII